MSKSQGDSGLMSEAGLVRYFEEDSGVGITPITLVLFAILFGVFILSLNIVF